MNTIGGDKNHPIKHLNDHPKKLKRSAVTIATFLKIKNTQNYKIGCESIWNDQNEKKNGRLGGFPGSLKFPP